MKDLTSAQVEVLKRVGRVHLGQPNRNSAMALVRRGLLTHWTTSGGKYKKTKHLKSWGGDTPNAETHHHFNLTPNGWLALAGATDSLLVDIYIDEYDGAAGVWEREIKLAADREAAEAVMEQVRKRSYVAGAWAELMDVDGTVLEVL